MSAGRQLWRPRRVQTEVVARRDAFVVMAGLVYDRIESSAAQQGPLVLWVEGRTYLRAGIGPFGGIWKLLMVILMMICTRWKFETRVWLAWGPAIATSKSITTASLASSGTHGDSLRYVVFRLAGYFGRAQDRILLEQSRAGPGSYRGHLMIHLDARHLFDP
jgi:hypothetical protein